MKSKYSLFVSVFIFVLCSSLLFSCGVKKSSNEVNSTDQKQVIEKQIDENSENLAQIETFATAMNSLILENDHVINFSNKHNGYILLYCSDDEFSKNDVGCSKQTLLEGSKIFEEASAYDVPFFLVLGKEDNPNLAETKDGIESTYEECAYPIYNDAENKIKNMYKIHSFPYWVFLDASGNVIETSAGWTMELQDERLNLINKLYEVK